VLKIVSLIKSLALLVAAVLTLNSYADTALISGVDYISAPDTQVRYLSNYSTEKPFEQTQAWLKVNTDYKAGDYTFAFKGYFNTNKKPYVSDASVSYNYDYTSGVSLGIRQFKQSWCRTYEPNNVWASEPDVFCKFKGLAEMSESAFAVQAYKSLKVGDWSVDTQVGVYRPNIDGQSKKLGPYVEIGPTSINKKSGISVDALDTITGSSYRASLMKSDIAQQTYANTYTRHLVYDSFFLGGEWSPAVSTNVRLSVGGYKGDQIDPSSLYSFDARSYASEVSYFVTSNNALSYANNYYRNITTYVGKANKQKVGVRYQSVALKTTWPKSWFSILQYGWGDDDALALSGKVTQKSGSEFIVRVGRVF
jgi:hypothetical protein